jgi:GDP-L-fucose synthase
MSANLSEKVLITGASGMVGSSLVNELGSRGYKNLFLTNSKDADLRNQEDVRKLVQRSEPTIAVLIAAKVGGVLANSSMPGSFAIDNLLIQSLILNELIKSGTKKIIFIGSSCVYPKDADLPLEPKSLLTGPLEESNKWYATAKLSMMMALDGVTKEFGCQTVTLMPTNLYGPRDNFDLNYGHLIPSLIQKCHAAKVANSLSYSVWGSGRAFREILYVDDLARAIAMVMENDSFSGTLNVGSGDERSILDIAESIRDAVGFKGKIEFDSSKPDGVLRKPLNSNPLRELGWIPQIDLDSGLKLTYEWYLDALKFGKVRDGL